MTTTLSRNQTWGFFGTICSNFNADEVTAAEAFKLAQAEIAQAYNLKPSVARDYLDSTSGRHVADQLSRPIGSVLTVAWLERDVRRFLRGYNAAQFSTTVSEAA